MRRLPYRARRRALFAGGRGFSTGYGTIYSSNLTSDARYGLGDWSTDEFAHTMRNGEFHAATGGAGQWWKQIVATVLAYGVFLALVCCAVPLRALWFRRVPG